MTDQALIIVRGGDSALRTFCSGALMAGLATHADFHEAWGMTDKDDDVESSNVGRVVFLRLPAANVSSCMQQLQQELDDATAVAIPVLAAF